MIVDAVAQGGARVGDFATELAQGILLLWVIYFVCRLLVEHWSTLNKFWLLLCGQNPEAKESLESQKSGIYAYFSDEMVAKAAKFKVLGEPQQQTCKKKGCYHFKVKGVTAEYIVTVPEERKKVSEGTCTCMSYVTKGPPRSYWSHQCGRTGVGSLPSRACWFSG